MYNHSNAVKKYSDPRVAVPSKCPRDTLVRAEVLSLYKNLASDSGVWILEIECV